MFGGMELGMLVAIAGVLALAFAVETALGFGAALITMALGGFLIDDLRDILVIAVPLNLVLSIYLVSRYHRHIDRRFLLTRLLPLMALGMPLGLYAFTAFDESWLKRLFGVFVAGVAGLELHRMRTAAVPRPVSTPVEVGLLLLGGAVHGAFSTGGPMAVYVTSRVLHDKNVYRATLSALWLVLGSALIAIYVYNGNITTTTLQGTLAVSPGIVVGMVAGEMLFRRVPVEVFRKFVFVTLLLSGVALVVRS